MTFSVRQWSVRARLGLLALAPILLLFVLGSVFPPDGADRSDWLQFIGRFHVLVIHFPIALILLIPIFEIAGRTRQFTHLRESIEFLLALTTLTAILAALLGWCLARSGGFSGSLVTQHMYGGIWVPVLCWLCWMLYGRFPGQRLDLVYSLGLVLAVGAVSWTGYRGGQLSQGEDHLTEHMPEFLRNLLGLPQEDKGPTAAAPNSFFTVRVEPVFAQHCVTCHGRSKQKSGLRLNTYEAVMRGGKDGVVVKSGDVKDSELLRRISLPAGDDKIMPPEGKPRLSADEAKLIELWINAGASPTLAADAIKDAPTTIAPPVAEVTFAEIDPEAVAKARAPQAAAVADLQKRYPDVLEYESRGSAGLAINVSLMGAKFGDDDLAALKPIADHIVVADFSNTAITDRSAPNLAAMSHLRLLRLMHTKITDATILALAGLNDLESLSVFGTDVTVASLKTLDRLPKLQHFYVGDTKIPANTEVAGPVGSKLSF